LEDFAKEQIKFNTEMIKLLAVLLPGAGVGCISLIINGISKASGVIFTAWGILVVIVCIVLIYKRYVITQKIISDGNRK
jgi:hypothetical protein